MGRPKPFPLGCIGYSLVSGDLKNMSEHVEFPEAPAKLGAGSDQVTVDLTLTLYQVKARVLESQYEDDVYMVTVIKPEGIGDLIDEEGTLMEHGKFSFDSTEEIVIDTELEIEITGVGSSTGIS